MTIAELQNEFFLSEEKHISPADFFVFLSHVTKKEKTFLLAHPEYSLNGSEEENLRNFLERRLQHEPVAYIVGQREFYGYDFSVTPDTLIPRPETELLVELTIDYIGGKQQVASEKQPSTAIVDIGTGSGNIIISLAKEIKKKYESPLVTYHATDISEPALAIAKKNAKHHHVDSIIKFHESDLLQSIPEELFSADEVIITANLPYLSEEIYQSSSHDVKNFEPKTALISDQAGLDHYYRLFEQIKNISKPTTLFLEISPEQSPLLEISIPVSFPEASVKIHKDLAQKDRIVEIHTR